MMLADVANFEVWIPGVCGGVKAHTARSQRTTAAMIAPECCRTSWDETDGNGVIHGRRWGQSTDVRLAFGQQRRNMLIHDLVIGLFNRELATFGKAKRVSCIAINASPTESHGQRIS